MRTDHNGGGERAWIGRRQPPTRGIDRERPVYDEAGSGKTYLALARNGALRRVEVQRAFRRKSGGANPNTWLFN